MEVVVTEEKKKIFRARKTMKISDRQQLETLHSTLLTTSAGLSESPSPPLMNGTHKEDGQKVTDKEQTISDSNSPDAPSPSSSSSPAPFLSLNLSPSPGSSPSPKAKEETTTPTSPSPFHSTNFENKKMENNEEEVKTGSSPPSSKELSTQAAKDSKENQESDTPTVTVMEKKEEEKTTTDDLAETVNDAVKDLPPSPPVSSSVSESTEPMETDCNTAKAKESEATTEQTDDEKPSPKSPPQTASSSATVPKQNTEIKEEDMKEEAVEMKEENENKELVKEEKIDLSSVKSETKKGKAKVGQHTKQSRPSSTPPSNTVPEEKSSTSGLKRTLSEGFEKEGQSVKRDGKRPKMEREELEAQLELKITAKAGSHHKLEKIVQQLVEERLRVMQLTIFDKNFQELKDRVEKIDCATKHQTAINTLQVKIARLSKKFGEANQASENKRKQEALAVAAAAAAAATAATAKTAPVANSPQAQRVLRRQAVELQPEVPREGMVPSVGETPAQSMKKEEEDEARDISPHTAMAKKLAEYNEGKCRADIKLRTITSHLENVLYRNCQRRSASPRPDRYASFIFRYLVPYDVYCEWVTKVNYVGLLGKEALPTNLRRTMRMYIEYRFPELSCDSWREIRDVINELLRVKRRPEFFRCTEDRTAVALW